MIILVFKNSFDPLDLDQEVKLFFGGATGSVEIETTEGEREDIGNAIFFAVNHAKDRDGS